MTRSNGPRSPIKLMGESSDVFGDQPEWRRGIRHAPKNPKGGRYMGAGNEARVRETAVERKKTACTDQGNVQGGGTAINRDHGTEKANGDRRHEGQSVPLARRIANEKGPGPHQRGWTQGDQVL